MTASTVHVTNLTPPGSYNPSRAYGRRHQVMTAGMVHVTNLTPGSDNPMLGELGRKKRLMRASSLTMWYD
jgi:hypothetical protein